MDGYIVVVVVYTFSTTDVFILHNTHIYNLQSQN